MTSDNTSTDDQIMAMTKRELRAVLFILARGTRGRDVQDITVAEIHAVLEQARG